MNLKLLTSILALVISSTLSSQTFADVTLTLNFENAGKDGNLFLAMYASENDYKNNANPAHQISQKVNNNDFTVSLPSIEKGEYAIKLYVDQNGNNELDFGPMGIPAEPYGFSQNGGAFGQPSFAEAKFEVEGDTEITIRLK